MEFSPSGIGSFALALSLFTCACGSLPASNATNSTNTSAPVTESVGEATIPPAETVPIPGEFTRTLDGTVGALPVRVRLSRQNDGFTGEYVYETGRPAMRTVANILFLDGSIDGGGTVRMNESTSDIDGNVTKTGTFEGSLTNTTAGMRFVGAWKKPDGSSSLPVVLNELISTPGGIRFIPSTMPSRDTRLASVVKVAYPRAEGGNVIAAVAFTTAVEGVVRERVNEFSQYSIENLRDGITVDMLALEIDYEIAAATDEIVSIVFTEYSNFGGAHPAGYVFARTFDLSRGRFLKLSDLTRDAGALRKELSRRCGELLPREEAFHPDLEPTEENFSQWYVTRRGLTFVFPVAHVAGDTVQAYLPFPEIKASLNPDGPLGALIR